MTLQLPTLLALVGAALLAVVVFAPRKLPAAPISLAPASFAPPVQTCDAAWPTRVDPRARGCDVPARLALVDALRRVGGAWAEAILAEAYDDEPDALVRAAIADALAAGSATWGPRSVR